MSKAISWFEVDHKGLAKLLANRNKAFFVYELFQNPWDEKGVTRVDAELVGHGRGTVRFTVRDDAPEGFKDLTHAFTLFAESSKKGNPTQRGRFNFGEKLVLSLCTEARIATTKGTIVFNNKGRRHIRTKTESGSTFEGILRLTREELHEVVQEVRRRLLPPANVQTYFNGDLLIPKVPIHAFETILPTVKQDKEGNLTPTQRKTVVEVYEADGETLLYEMGIPVCSTHDKWHVNIGQKVPINLDRTGVTGSYLRSVRVAVINEMYDKLNQTDASETWIRDVIGDKRCTRAAVTHTIKLRFGEKRVAFDPSDPEANKIAVSRGYNVIHGGSLSKEEWENVKRFEVAPPAGKVTPSPKPYSEDGNPAEVVLPENWNTAQRVTVAYTRKLAEELLEGFTPKILIVRAAHNQFGACYSSTGGLHFNLSKLGRKWFEAVLHGDTDALHSLLIHELAHHFEKDHLSSGYHEACCRLGAKLTRLALIKPDIFVPSLQAG
jgi:hypothetical protein